MYLIRSPGLVLLASENEVQHSISPCCLLCHLEKEVTISAFLLYSVSAMPPGCPLPHCAVPPTDIGVVQVPHEDQGDSHASVCL